MHPFFVYFRLFYAISVRIAFRFAFFLKKRTHNRYNPRGSILISVLIYNVSIIRHLFDRGSNSCDVVRDN